MGDRNQFCGGDLGVPWINEDGEIVHPDAPRGWGGPGRFRYGNCLGEDYGSYPPIPHHKSWEIRYRMLSEKEKAALKAGSGTKGPPPQNAPPVTKAETLTIQGVTVNILADGTTTDTSIKGKTSPDFTWTAAPGADQSGPADDPTKSKITRLKGPPPALTLTIQTIYGPGASASGRSVYGLGTTQHDIDNGDTSLGFHESCHRQDLLDYLRANKPPVFAGRVGITVAAYRQAIADFPKAVAEYSRKMQDDTKAKTDEVGKTKTQYDAENKPK